MDIFDATPDRRSRVLDEEARDRVLGHLRAIPNVARAARMVGVSVSSIYALRDRDDDFAAEMKDAIDEGIERMEEEAHRRAFVGYSGKPVVDREGRIVTEVVEYSDSLAALLLRAHRPSKYRDNVTAEITGSLNLDPHGAAERVAKLLKLAQERAAREAPPEDLDDLL
jgi:hypothetical protein